MVVSVHVPITLPRSEKSSTLLPAAFAPTANCFFSHFLLQLANIKTTIANNSNFSLSNFFCKDKNNFYK